MKAQRGFTLVELLVTITIMAVVTTMIIGIWMAVQRSYSYAVNSDDARSQAREAMARMVREIRDLQAPSSTQSAIVSASSNDLTFHTAFNDAAANSDPGVNGLNHVYLVRYWYAYDSTKSADTWVIYRRRDSNGNGLDSSDPTIVVAKDVVNGSTLPGQTGPLPLFQYFQSGSTTALASPVSSPATIASIQIRIVTDLNPNKAPTYFDLATTVTPRN